MKTLEQAQRLRNHVLACLEHAAQAADADERRAWLTFVVVGGGPTGVEFAGALAELRRLVGREYREFAADEMRIVVVEGADRAAARLPGEARPLRAEGARAARRRGADGRADRVRRARRARRSRRRGDRRRGRSSGRPACARRTPAGTGRARARPRRPARGRRPAAPARA